MKSTLTAKQRESLNAIVAEYPNAKTLTRTEFAKATAKAGLAPPHWILQDKDYYVSRGVFHVPHELLEIPTPKPTKKKSAPKKEIVPNTETVIEQFALVPEPTKGFVNHGHYKDIEKVVESGLFYPLFITGLSGNGKTLTVENVCANLGRSLVRVNITIETDEDDLLGGFRLENGETKFHKGPIGPDQGPIFY